MITITEAEAKLAELKSLYGERAKDRADYKNIVKTLGYYNESVYHNDDEYELDIMLNFRARSIDDLVVAYGLFETQDIKDGSDTVRTYWIVSNGGFKRTQINPASLEMMVGFAHEGAMMWKRVFRRVDGQQMPMYSYFIDKAKGQQPLQHKWSTEGGSTVPVNQRSYPEQQAHYQNQFAAKQAAQAPNTRDYAQQPRPQQQPRQQPRPYNRYDI